MSVLRYPGGKTRAIKSLEQFVDVNDLNDDGNLDNNKNDTDNKDNIDDKNNRGSADGTAVLVSPFFGGGSFELYLNSKYNIKIMANDIYEPLINFWKCLQENCEHLIEEVYKLHPLSKAQFTKIKLMIDNNELDKFHRAA